MNNTLCIYHGDCDDGFGAAWVVKNSLSNVDFYPGVYQQDPPDVTGKNVLMVDFSYKRPVISKMAETAKSIKIIDHHKTAQADLASPIADNVTSIFDMTKSGAMLTWEHFQTGLYPPLLIHYIQDRDLWKKALPHGDEFTAWLRSYPQNFDDWDELISKACSSKNEDIINPDVVIEGAAILRNNVAQIERAKGHVWRMTIAGHDVPVTHTTVHFSEVAGELSEKEPFGAAIFLVENGGSVVFSLRSKHYGEDVSAIATKFGGGGHKHAAGFSVSLVTFMEMMR